MLELIAYRIGGDDVVLRATSETLRADDVIPLLAGHDIEDPELADGEYPVRPDAEREACRLFGVSHVAGDYRIGAISIRD